MIRGSASFRLKHSVEHDFRAFLSAFLVSIEAALCFINDTFLCRGLSSYCIRERKVEARHLRRLPFREVSIILAPEQSAITENQHLN